MHGFTGDRFAAGLHLPVGQVLREDVAGSGPKRVFLGVRSPVAGPLEDVPGCSAGTTSINANELGLPQSHELVLHACTQRGAAHVDQKAVPLVRAGFLRPSAVCRCWKGHLWGLEPVVGHVKMPGYRLHRARWRWRRRQCRPRAGAGAAALQRKWQVLHMHTCVACDAPMPPSSRPWQQSRHLYFEATTCTFQHSP